MFKKVLASIGIGAAKVDAVVLQEHQQPGGELQVNVVMNGGDVDQEINGLDLALMTRIKQEVDDATVYKNHCLQSWKVNEAFVLQAGEERTVSLNLPLHDETPLTALNCPQQQSRVWLQTGLDIDLALDPSDEDALRIIPTVAMERFMIAIERCGLRMVKADVEAGNLKGNGFQSTAGCYQELEYKPTSMLTSLQEVEVSFVKQAGITHALIEVDRHFRGDSYLSMSWTDNESVEQLEAELRRLLSIG